MKRVLLAAVLVLAGAASYAQLEATFAGLTDAGETGAYFKANVTQAGTADPGHAYEDVNNDGRFTNGTDIAVEDHEILDGRYQVSDPDHGLVVPRSVGPIEPAAGAIDLQAGTGGHLVLEVKLEATQGIRLTAGTQAELGGLVAEAGGTLEIEAGGDLDVAGAALEAGGAITLEAGQALRAREAQIEAEDDVQLTADQGAVLVNAASLETEGALTVEAGGAARADDARLGVGGLLRISAGSDVYVKRATLETPGEIELTAGSSDAAIFVEGSRLLDADETAQAGPSGVDVVGTPAEGEVATES